jgi:hypothetical protein
MAVISKVNPNFPIPGVDQSTKGFRDNFNTIKTEIENLQSKTITLVGDVTSLPTIVDSGTSGIVIDVIGNVFRESFSSANMSGNTLTVNHNLNQQIVIVQVSDNNHQVLIPDAITLTNSMSFVIDLTSFVPISGTWNVVARG